FVPDAEAVDVDSLLYFFTPPSGSLISNPEIINPNMLLSSSTAASFDLHIQGFGCCLGDSAVCDDVFTIEVIPAPSASPINNLQFCLPASGSVEVDPLTLFNIQNPQSIITDAQWTFTGGNPSSASGLNPGLVTYNSTGNYSVQLSLLTAGNACNASSSASFSIVSTPPVPQIQINQAPFCQGDSVFLSIANPVSQINYEWSGPNSYSFTGLSDTILSVQLVNAGTYSVVAGPQGCSSNATADLQIDSGPPLNISPDAVLCQGDTLEIVVSGGTTYNWSASPFISSLTEDTVRVWPSSNSTFTVNSQSAAGCPGQASVTVTVNSLPAVSLVAPSPVCAGSGNQQLLGSPAQGSQSGDAAVYGGTGVLPNGSFPTDFVSSFQAYYVYTDPSGCFDSAFAQVNIIDPPIANAGADISNLCLNDPQIVLLGGGTAPGNWQVIPGILQSNGQFDPVEQNTFEAIYEIGSGSCYDSDTTIITVNGLPSINLVENDFELCANEGSIQLNSIPATGVVWSGPGVDATGLFNPSNAGVNPNIITVGITDANQCYNSDQISVNILGFPDATFYTSDVFACEQQIIDFTPLQAGLDEYNWNFGDNGTANGEFVQHEYNPGEFVAELEVVSGTCRDTFTSSIHVQILPQAALTLDSDELCPGEELVFSNASSGIYQQVSWLVNAVQISNSPVGGNFLPSPSECADSVYTLSIQLNDSTCGVIPNSVQFTVHPPPQAIVAMDPVVTSICPTTPVYFVNNGCNPAVNLTWDFGFGGPTATGINPPPVFFPDTIEEVAWPVVLSAADIYNCGLTRDTLLVTVNPNNINIAVNLSSSDVCLGDTVFIDNNSSSFTGIDCLWNFGDNSQSAACQPQFHVYTQAGNFNISLTETNVCYSSTQDYPVVVHEIPDISFSFDSGPHCAGDAIHFSAQTEPAGLIPVWSFGNSSAPAGEEVDFSFDSAGVYNVSVTVQDGPACPATSMQPVTIDYLPSAEILASTQTLCPGEPITFTGEDNSGNALFTWQFGDNSAENGQVVTHAFQNANSTTSTYTVVLTTSNLQATCQNQDSLQVQVYPSTNAAFNLPSDLLCKQSDDPFILTPENLAQNATSYIWLLNGTDISQSFEPEITIDNTGNYTLKLIAENIFGCPDSAETAFDVQPAPHADFILNRTFFCEGETLILQDQSEGEIVSWFWNSGNFMQEGSGLDSTILGLAGTFSVTLIAGDQNGCKDTTQQINAYRVYPKPQAAFTVNPGEIDVLHPGYTVTSYAQNNDFCRYEISDLEGVIDSCNFSESLSDSFQEYLTIIQTVTSVAGCEDKMIQHIRILRDFVLDAPTVFTPNGDGHNDIFKPVLVNVAEDGFQMLIFDRRGNIVFQTSSIHDGWDGSLLGNDWNQADQMEYEIYLVKMKGRSVFDGRKREYDGKLKLVREGR
ncbi:MAG: PKD domain-containing protein, partial [Bacteroidetes bacterium]|nr:PKD domain-containing protein [Bacteroidota bacterium]